MRGEGGWRHRRERHCKVQRDWELAKEAAAPYASSGGRLTQVVQGVWRHVPVEPIKIFDGFEWLPNPQYAGEAAGSDGDDGYDDEPDEAEREDYYVRESEREALREWFAGRGGGVYNDDEEDLDMDAMMDALDDGWGDEGEGWGGGLVDGGDVD